MVQNRRLKVEAVLWDWDLDWDMLSVVKLLRSEDPTTVPSFVGTA